MNSYKKYYGFRILRTMKFGIHLKITFMRRIDRFDFFSFNSVFADDTL